MFELGITKEAEPTSKTGIIVVGAGNISEAYANHIVASEGLTLNAVTDLDLNRAEKLADKYNTRIERSLDELLKDPSEVLLNITYPLSHFLVTKTALEAGKSVFSEKPLAATYAQGLELVRLAKETGTRLGCAPDVFLTTHFQEVQRVLKEGKIGKPTGAIAKFSVPGPEAWHPDPAFLYKKGAGPVFDMSPYYLTFLIHSFGNIDWVTAYGDTQNPVRTVAKGEKQGLSFEVDEDVPTRVLADCVFENGMTATMEYSFEGMSNETYIEITGEEGVLRIGDPNEHRGNVIEFSVDGEEWVPVEKNEDTEDDRRGMGLSEFATAVDEGRPSPMDAEGAPLQVLKVMETISVKDEVPWTKIAA